jgi:hypothetical protein
MKAFPNGKFSENQGMNLRDYFAAKVMQGIISAIGNKFVEKPDYLEISKESYKFADAMMKARNDS